MYKKIYFISLFSDALLKLSFGFIFFNYGYAKLNSLFLGKGEGLINMVSTIPFFSTFPVFYSWSLAIAEIAIFIGLMYGVLNFLPYSNLITKLSGLLSLILSIIIIYQHIFAWGDNVFSYGPFSFLNIEDGKKTVFGQILFFPISLYIIFNNTQNNNYINDEK